LDDNNKKDFKNLMDGVTEVYNPDKKLSVVAFQIYWNALKPYSYQQVECAVGEHLKDTCNGRFYPKVADIIQHIEGGAITVEQVIGAARAAKTPLGILCRIFIGTYDLEKQVDPFVTKAKAEECIQFIDEWKKRGALGQYSDHEISIMVKHGVSPSEPFNDGLAPPSNAIELNDRAQRIADTQLLEAPHEHCKEEEAKGLHESVVCELKKMFKNGDLKKLLNE
jgi:hypothetical protein